MENATLKAIEEETVQMLEDRINHFMSEEMEDCFVHDIKYLKTEDSFIAFILYN